MVNDEYLAIRLEDPALIDRAVDIGELSVPVGGKRRGGFVCVADPDHGAQVMTILARHDGFPNVRLVLSEDPESMDNVRWGDDEPACPVPEISTRTVPAPTPGGEGGTAVNVGSHPTDSHQVLVVGRDPRTTGVPWA